MTTTKKLLLLTFLSALLQINLSAQNTDGEARVEKFMSKVTFIPIGFEVEAALGKSVTFDAQLNLRSYLSWVASTTTNNTGSYFALYPVLYGEFRDYYSLDKRKENGKAWRGNTGPFFGLRAGYSFSPMVESFSGDNTLVRVYRPNFGFGPIWGYHYTATQSSNFNFSAYVGPAVYVYQGGGAGVGLTGRATIGFAFGKYR
jgi:hypothetical protein